MLAHAIAALLACHAPSPSAHGRGPADTGQEAGTDRGDDTATAPLAFTDIEVEILAMGTSAALRWTTSEASTGAVRLADGSTSAWEEALALEHEVTVVALPPDSKVTVELIASVDDRLYVSEPFSFTTGSLSADLPTVDVYSPGDPAPGYRLLGLFDGVDPSRPARVLALDRAGRVVWEHVMGPGTMVGSVEPDLRRGRLLISSGTQIQAIDLVDGSALHLPGDDYHHDLALTPDGAIAAPARRVVELEGSSFAFDDIVEISPTGARRVVKAAEVLLAELGLDPSTMAGGENPMGLDVMHVNAIEYDEAHDRYVIGAPGLGTLIGLQRASGEVDFALGHLTPTKLSAAPRLTHQIALDDGTIHWFVNQSESDPCARVWQIALEGGVFVEQNRWPLDRCEAILGLGGVAVLPGGHRLVTWAHTGVVEELDADGAVVQRLEFGGGLTVGYAAWAASLQPDRACLPASTTGSTASRRCG